MRLSLRDKLEILADAAKYDASCASSGTAKRSSMQGGLGSSEGMGICHSYTPDGRCVSLLKILLTNHCIFDCSYCVNRRSSNVRRARFSVDEVVKLTIDFYRRNYIEGLFLSSGIIRNSDYTMEQLALVAKKLRLEHGFHGYIHLKTIPDAAPELIEEAGRWADRLSINIELPQEDSIRRLAPEKRGSEIRRSMGRLRLAIEAAREPARTAKPAPFAPAGQSTQMIVGADTSNDRQILDASSQLYSSYRLKRVYYSAFSPIPEPSPVLPLQPAPLLREHRLYQADWMLRFYGFDASEIVTGDDGLLDLAIDPKFAWALANRSFFPVDVNTADKEALLRTPGLGPKAVKRILCARRLKQLRLEDVARLTRSIKACRPFLIAADWRPLAEADAELARPQAAPRQLDLFA